jgi:RHS repeat-associated protein
MQVRSKNGCSDHDVLTSEYKILLLLAGFALCFFASRLAAQDYSNTAVGIQPGITYLGGEIDAINPLNGIINVHIPLISYPQRGGKLKLDFSLRQAMKLSIWVVKGNPKLDTETTYSWWNGLVGSPFWLSDDQDVTTYNVAHLYMRPYPQQGSVTDNEISWSTADGATHSGYQLSGSSVQASVDGTAFSFPQSYSTLCTVNCYTTDGDGISYRTSSTVIREDANGNKITGSMTPYDGSNYNDAYINSYVDTMGRAIPAIPTATTDLTGCPTGTTSADIWTLPGYAGGSITYKFCAGPQTQTLTDSCGADNQYPKTNQVSMLTAVILPNGLSWQFSYGGAGATFPSDSGGASTVLPLLTGITYPMGGTINYTYSCTMNVGTFVSARTVNPDPQHSPSRNYTTQYTYTGVQGSGPQTTETDPLGAKVVHNFQRKNGASPTLETLTHYYDSSSNLLRTDEMTYTAELNAGDCTASQIPGELNSTYQPTCKITTLANGHVTKQVFAYCCDLTFAGATPSWNYLATGTYGLLADTNVYDFGSGSAGSLLKEMQTAYYFTSHSSYLAANLLRLPSSVTALGGSGNPVSSVSYTYDEAAYSEPYPGDGAIANSHDSLSTTVRGNLTTTAAWYKGQNPAYLYVHNYVYDTGEVAQKVDARNNSTTFIYDPAYSGALVTTVTNARNQSESFAYDINLGLKTSDTDANLRTTTYSYDAWGRPTHVIYPDKCPNSTVYGESDYSYNDSVPYAFTQNTVMCGANSGATSMQTETDVDGFARTVKEKLLTDPSGTVSTDTTYDAIGRKSTVSNPYRSTGEATYGSTIYTYDAMNRPLSVKHPDNTSLNYSYAGAAVKITDEGNGTKGVSTVTQKDALGRVVSVCEVTSSAQQGSNSADTTPTSCGQDIAATGFLTAYAYDPLGNLLTVAQGALTQRTFQYDSLSRLTSASNPESGTTTYTYDGSGNMLTRTRPAPNQAPGGTALTTATYAYDNLNRPTSVTYADAYNTASPTPSAYYDYDLASNAIFTVGGTLNPVGRMVDSYVKDSSGNYIAGRAFSYNEVGQTISLAECDIDDCAARWYYTLGYGYDVSGPASSMQLTSAGATNFTLGYAYNGMGQLTNLTSSWSDATHPGALLSNVAYGPLGGTVSATLGSGETESFAYDNRDRLGCGNVVKNGTTLYSVALSNANGQCSTYTGSGYSGNGNVLASHDSINGNWTYTYDDFNRLVSASASAGPLSGTSMSWSYDRFGNRWTQTQTGAATQSYSYTGLNNRIDGATYDAAGNMLTANGNTYLYDDENRIVRASLYLGGTASYSYDAEGQRVRKAVGTAVDEYLYDAGGRQIGDMQPNGAMKRMELYAGGRHLATYDIASNATYFIHGDWLGTERLRTNAAGAAYESCTNLPFGDEQQCSGGADISPMHFTGKPRDTETTLDYFGARYYSSGMARWMSPDWADKPTTVPYAQFGDPQSLNLYGYVTNNPVSSQDGDGHDVPAPPPGNEYVQLSGASNPVQAQQMALSMGLTNFTILGFDSTGTEQYNSAQQTYGRQPNGSYIAPPSKIDPIVNLANPLPGPLGGCEQCVCATSYFSGVTTDTSQWIQGDPVVIDGKVNPNIKENTAVATFDENGRYFPASDHKNSGIFRGTRSGDAPGAFHILDQWPTVRDKNGNEVRKFSPAQERPVRPTGTWPSDNSNAYYVITVPR